MLLSVCYVLCFWFQRQCAHVVSGESWSRQAGGPGCRPPGLPSLRGLGSLRAFPWMGPTPKSPLRPLPPRPGCRLCGVGGTCLSCAVRGLSEMLPHCHLPSSSALLGASRLRQEGCLPRCGGRQGGVLGGRRQDRSHLAGGRLRVPDVSLLHVSHPPPQPCLCPASLLNVPSTHFQLPSTFA